MTRERLTASELREVEEGTHIVVRLHDDEYWEMGGGKVSNVTKADSGEVTVSMSPLSGPQFPCRLNIPADARKGLTYDGSASGARNLRVDHVYER